MACCGQSEEFARLVKEKKYDQLEQYKMFHTALSYFNHISECDEEHIKILEDFVKGLRGDK